jgi:protein tyrosine phosphatase (PTP) superfamily phosphohydrolase (DUF442 family)
MKRLVVPLVMTALAALSCSGERIDPDEVEGPYTWGGVSNVTHVRDLWFSGQPDTESLRLAKENGVEVVINLRDPGESDWDERGAVEGLGMTYHSVPVQKTGPFTRESFSRIAEILEAHEGAGILVHCSSANRAGGWFATYLVEEHGMTVDDALAVGRRTGITKEGITKRVRAYLAEPDGT